MGNHESAVRGFWLTFSFLKKKIKGNMLGQVTRRVLQSPHIAKVARRCMSEDTGHSVKNRTHNMLEGDLMIPCLIGWTIIAIPPAWCLTHGEAITEACARFVGVAK